VKSLSLRFTDSEFAIGEVFPAAPPVKRRRTGDCGRIICFDEFFKQIPGTFLFPFFQHLT
jgi:hypothetical protein